MRVEDALVLISGSGTGMGGAAMPRRSAPTLLGPDGDYYYAVFVLLVLLGFAVGTYLFIRGK